MLSVNRKMTIKINAVAFGFHPQNSSVWFWTLFALQIGYMVVATTAYYILNNPTLDMHCVRIGNFSTINIKDNTSNNTSVIVDNNCAWYQHVSVRQPSWQKSNKLLWGWTHSMMISMFWLMITIANTNKLYLNQDSPWKLLLDILFTSVIIALLIMFIATIYVVGEIKTEEAIAQYAQLYSRYFNENNYKECQEYVNSLILYVSATTGFAIAGNMIVGSATISSSTLKSSDLDNVIANATTFWLPAMGGMFYAIWATLNLTRLYNHCNRKNYPLHTITKVGICKQYKCYNIWIIEQVLPAIPIIGLITEVVIYVGIKKFRPTTTTQLNCNALTTVPTGNHPERTPGTCSRGTSFRE